MNAKQDRFVAVHAKIGRKIRNGSGGNQVTCLGRTMIKGLGAG